MQTTSFKESVKPIGTLIFKNSKNQYVPINITTLNTVFKFKNKPQIIESKLNRQKKENFISINQEPIIQLSRGSLLLDKIGNLYFFIGSRTNNREIELSPVFKIRINEPRRYSLNTKLKEWKLVEVDEVGNLFEKFIF